PSTPLFRSFSSLQRLQTSGSANASDRLAPVIFPQTRSTDKQIEGVSLDPRSRAENPNPTGRTRTRSNMKRRSFSGQRKHASFLHDQTSFRSRAIDPKTRKSVVPDRRFRVGIPGRSAAHENLSHRSIAATD